MDLFDRHLASRSNDDDLSDDTTFFLVPGRLQDTSALQSILSFSLQDMIVSLATYTLVAAFCVLWFCWYRTTRDGFRFLTPRRFVWPADVDPVVGATLLRQPASIFGWIGKILAWDESDILRAAGHDSVVYLRTLSMCFKVLCIYAVYGFAVVLPINWNGGLAESVANNKTQDVYRIIIEDDEVKGRIQRIYTDEEWSWGTLTRLTILNVHPSDNWSMFAHFIGFLFVHGLLLYFLNGESHHFVSLRRKYLSQPHSHRRAIVVEEIPPDLRTCADLRFYFSALYPDRIERIILMHNTGRLDKAIKKREGLRDRLEHTLIKRAKTKPSGFWNNRQHAKLGQRIETLIERLRDVTDDIETERTKLRQHTVNFASAGDDDFTGQQKVAGRFGLRKSDEVARLNRRMSLAAHQDSAAVPSSAPTTLRKRKDEGSETVNPMAQLAPAKSVQFALDELPPQELELTATNEDILPPPPPTPPPAPKEKTRQAAIAKYATQQIADLADTPSAGNGGEPEDRQRRRSRLSAVFGDRRCATPFSLVHPGKAGLKAGIRTQARVDTDPA